MKNITLSFENIFLIEKALQDALWEKEFQLSQIKSEPLKEFISKDVNRAKQALDAFKEASGKNNYIL